MSLRSSMVPLSGQTPGKKLWKAPGVVMSIISIVLAVGGIIVQLPDGLQALPGILFSLIVGLLGVRMAVVWIKVLLFTPPATVMPPAALQPSQTNHASLPPDFQSATMAWGNNTRLSSYAPSLQPSYAAAFAYSQSGEALPTPLFPQQSGNNTPPRQMWSAPPPDASAMQNAPAPDSFTPIDQDELFKLDAPVNGVHCFMLPKEGEPMIECQDRYALNAQQSCYAVADGVAGSFVAGPWASIISREFVQHDGNFSGQGDFNQWLTRCSQRWQQWMENRWVPTMNAMRARNGEKPGDWSNDIRTGAQTTLVGCSLRSTNSLRKTNQIARVFAIGDGEFFHFRPDSAGGWELLRAFPYQESSQFTSRPNTLMTMLRPDLMERSWMSKQTLDLVSVRGGDRLVLTSDTLAKWFLTQIEQQTNRWQPFLAITELQSFEQRIREELHQARIEDDDLTMLVIPV